MKKISFKFVFLLTLLGSISAYSFFYTSKLIRTPLFLIQDSLSVDTGEVVKDKIVSKKNKVSWVDSVFAMMTPDERIGQLFMVAAYSNKDRAHKNEIAELVKKYKIGGLIFFQGGPLRQANLTNYYQSLATIPLFVAIDGEWGLAMRLDSTQMYPKQMTLGAIQDDRLIYDMGAQIANECRRIGMQINFAPVVDINSNPLNPVIGFRSFGENKYDVASKGLMYMKGMQDRQVLACGKHFPGHGDTDADSHKALPVINHSRERMDTLELFPFKILIEQGLKSMMVAHINIPAYDTLKKSAASISKSVVNDLLKDSLQFKGLVFTDALNMKGVSANYKPGFVDVKALLAGNDVLLFSEDVPVAIQEIKNAIDSCLITQDEIDIRCKKILEQKEWAGLNNNKQIVTKGLYGDLNTKKAELLKAKLYEASLTLLSNKDSLIPLKRLDTLRIASLSLGDKNINTFQKTLDYYAPISHYNLPDNSSAVFVDSILTELKKHNLVLVCVNNGSLKPTKNFGVSEETVRLVDSIHKYSKVVLNLMANPYSLSKFANAEKLEAIIMPYEENRYTQTLSAELIFGGVNAKGKLPVSVLPHFPIGTGIQIGNPTRFKYVMPEEINVNPLTLKKIDVIVKDAIAKKAFPGCVVFAAKDGKVFLNKAYGNHTYEEKQTVKNTDIYDLASVTKVTATLFACFRLIDENKFSWDERLCDHLVDVDSCNKQDIILRDMLTHQARLKSWIPFWQNTVEKGELKNSVYSKVQTDSFPMRVADSIYIKRDYVKSIYKKIIDSPLEEKKQYLYSDLGYYFLKRLVENITSETLDAYVQKIYNEMGMTTTGYLPRNRFDLNRIPPTEYDIAFRKQLIQGDVHDQGAAMMGGVGGHAGLFSNANDIAKIMQLYMDSGYYGGKKYINPATLKDAEACQFCPEGNRRGIGFEKPEPNAAKESPVCKSASLKSFGHSGFTGTFVWADPENGLVYVFLSNRVYPDAENKKINTLGVRGKIHQVLYDAVK